MTAVSNQTPSAGSGLSQAQSSAALQSVDFDTFIKLLVAQLENQDPLNPMDGTEFTAQMAQFAQIEQQLSANNYLEQISQQQNFGAQTLATSYIGKDVLAPGHEFSMTEGGGLDFAYDLEAAASDVQIEIYTQDGTLVKTIDGDNAPGVNYMSWDGLDEDGNPAASGDYKMILSAVDGEGEKLVAEPYVYGYALGVSGGAGNLQLSLADGRDADFEDIVSVRVRFVQSGGESES